MGNNICCQTDTKFNTQGHKPQTEIHAPEIKNRVCRWPWIVCGGQASPTQQGSRTLSPSKALIDSASHEESNKHLNAVFPRERIFTLWSGNLISLIDSASHEESNKHPNVPHFLNSSKWSWNKALQALHDAPPLRLHKAKWPSLIFACHPIMLYICTKFCEIIWNIKVIEWTWFLYWKLQREIILQKDTFPF